MPLKFFNSSKIAAPAAQYTHGCEIPAGARTIVLSGQIGQRADGTIPEDVIAQAEAAWDNVTALLAEAGMGMSDIVMTRTYVTRPEDYAKVSAVRNKRLGSHKPTSTGLCILALARPQFLVEVEVTAAK
jgi:enamine deaminase RidA (YjgF/YER057c/UK114 family)